jgi:D-alanyl-D-alanine dipeptidase
MRGMRRMDLRRYVLLPILSAFLIALSVATSAPAFAQTALPPKPAPAPERWRGLIGEYGPDDDVIIVFERDGKLVALLKHTEVEILEEVDENTFKFPPTGPHAQKHLTFERDPNGRATQLAIDAVVAEARPRGPQPGSPAGVGRSGRAPSEYKRRNIEPESGNQLHVTPLRPVADLMKEALAAQPPNETGEFRESDLAELTKLDPTIRLEIRYATTNNFLGTKFYSQARAFMQRPAAEAVVRANQKLKAYGYGLLVHDAYRPWYVTKVFWDATPEDKHIFVADPAKGSRHNRGCAVDLTLYDLKTKKPIEMVSTYDETTARAYPDYPGGTSLQRWHRKLLRDVMESEGFTVYEAEWWHFDYKDWQKYRIGNVRFEVLQNRSR